MIQLRAVAGVAILVAVGCDGPRDLEVSVELDPLVAPEVVAIRLDVLRSGCDSRDLDHGETVRRGASFTQEVPALAPGVWGFRAQATNSACEWVADVCEERTLPLDPGTLIQLVLHPQMPEPFCSTGACMDGVCGSPPDGGGTADGGMCAGEELDGLDNDCDRLVDEDFVDDVFQDSETHCGGYMRACDDRPNMVGSCEMGVCTRTCRDGFADCNSLLDDGCEASLTSSSTCGSCDNPCEAPTSFCTAGSCTMECASGLTTCSGECADLTRSFNHCGACGASCARAHAMSECVAGTCIIRACDLDWDDCNGVALDGCEASLRSVSHCAFCNTACNISHAEENCDTGSCVMGRCDTGYRDCNGSPSDGCEGWLRASPNCGACGNDCGLGEVCCLGTPANYCAVRCME